ncbi:hypothetical protein MJ561_25210 [Klebsiella pneumoniae]|nr:hypothetical protein MJ561_25210 [Klebsiella pneumoniae]
MSNATAARFMPAWAGEIIARRRSIHGIAWDSRATPAGGISFDVCGAVVEPVGGLPLALINIPADAAPVVRLTARWTRWRTAFGSLSPLV